MHLDRGIGVRADLVFVLPVLGLPILQPEDHGSRIRRIVLCDRGYCDLTLEITDVRIWVAVAGGSLKQTADYVLVIMLSFG